MHTARTISFASGIGYDHRPVTMLPLEGHQELVLVVDDEDAVRAIAVDGLRELGYGCSKRMTSEPR